MEPPPKHTTSKFLYLRPQDSSELFLIERKLFHETGAIPEHSILKYAYTGITKHVEPIYWQHEIPVFPLAMPAAVFRKILDTINLPHLRNGSLLADLDKNDTTNAYADYWGFGVQEEPNQNTDSEPESKGRVVKLLSTLDDYKIAARAWLAEQKQKLDAVPAFRRLERICQALAVLIRNHPSFDDLDTGARRGLRLEFVNSREEHVDFTNWLTIPGHPGFQVSIASEFIHLKQFGNLIKRYEMPQLVTQLFAQAFDYKYIISNYKPLLKLNSKRKTAFRTTRWPAGGLDLEPGQHEVLEMIIEPFHLGNRQKLKYLNDAEFDDDDDDDDDGGST